MTEFEHDLRTRLREDAEQVRPDVDAAWTDVTRRLTAAAPVREQPPAWRRQWWAAPVAAGLIAVLGALALVAGDDTTTVAVGPPEAADHASEAGQEAAELRRGAPGPDPAPRASESPEAPLDGAAEQSSQYGAPPPDETTPVPSAEPPEDSGGYVGPFEGMYPAVTWEGYDRLRAENEAGRETWALDPEQVATAYLRERIGVEADGRLRLLDEQVAEYLWSGGRLTLWRYGPPGDPWVVTASDAAGVEVSIGDYRGTEVFVGVRSERAGTVTVRTGPFDSEWVDIHSEEVVAGGSTEATLQVGWGGVGPDALLVEVQVDHADGSTAIARYRANLVTAPPGE